MSDIWTEKYRPQTITDYVWVDDNQQAQVQNWIRDGVLPNLLISGSPGTGKTTLAKCLLNELKVENADIKYVNGSHTNGVDDIRALSRFIETMPLGEFRYVLLDECLDENTLVVVLRQGQQQLVPIRDLDQTNDLVKSWNIEQSRIEWRTFELLDKGLQDVVEIEFENSETVVCTLSHKWYVEDPKTGEITVVKTEQLENYMHILTTIGI